MIEEIFYDTPESTPILVKQPTSSTLNLNLQSMKICSSDSLAIVVTHMVNTISKAYPSDHIKVSAEEIFVVELSNILNLEELEFLRAYAILTGDAKKYDLSKALPALLRTSWILIQIKNK